MATQKANQKIAVKKKSGDVEMMQDCGFARYLAQNPEAARNYAGAMRVMDSMESLAWRGDSAVPTGSPVADILDAFRAETDLPLELPLHSFYFFLSAYLLEKSTRLKFNGQSVSPEVWTVVLAPSGAGKSYSLARIACGAPTLPTIQGIASGAKLIETMAENEAAGRVQAMLVDEFGQLLKGMENPAGPLADVKNYKLLAYDGVKMERNTKAASIVVNDSRMAFFGANVDETFYSILSPESMLDGMAQRYCYCIAERDPNRPFWDYPTYNNEALETVVKDAWARILAVPIHEAYSYAPEALAAYNHEFRTLGKLIEGGKQVNVSFYRRLMQRTHKLALLMHVAMGDASPVVSKTAMVYAIRQTRLHIIDTARLIAMKSPKNTGIHDAVADLAARFAEKGQSITARDIQRSVWAARDSNELAQDLLAAHQNMGAPQQAKRRKAKVMVTAETSQPAPAASMQRGRL
jgi:hypothetical protein